MANDKVDLLKSLGLNQTQAIMYLSILEVKEPTGKTISKKSGIAREAVYHTLPSLETLGLIQRKLTSPITYRAIDYKKAISVPLKSKKD